MGFKQNKLRHKYTATVHFFVFMWAALVGGIAYGSEPIPYQSDWLKNHYEERIAHFTIQPLRSGDIVFIGDSITEQGLNWAIRFNDLRVRNRGISGDTTYGVLARLDELKMAQPKAIFLKIGVNDIFNFYYIKQIKNLSSVSENIENIVIQLNEALPNTPIFVQSILPDHRDFITDMVQTVNQQIKTIKHARFTYIDLHSAFLSSNGTMNSSLTTDGTHLNQAGYALWAEQLAPIMAELK